MTSLGLYHEQCQQISTTRKYQLSEIESIRKDLLTRAKKTQEKRCLTSLRSGYCLKMQSDNVNNFLKLPFLRPDDFFVNDSIVYALGMMRNDVTSFIKSIYENFTDMPKVFANVKNEDLTQTLPFLPANVKPRDFLACSTLPALFGHCWSLELRHAYIDFLMDIAKELPPNVFDNFREHWLFECFKNYIHVSKIHNFLKLSIGDCTLQLVRENSNDPSRLTSYARDFVSKMRNNISAFPIDVRLLIKKFSELAPNDSQKLNRIEIILLDCILIPAITSPKAYSILPASYQIDNSPKSPIHTLNALAQHLGYILHPDQTVLSKLSEMDVIELQKVPLREFLYELTNIDESTLNISGLRVADLMTLTKKDSISLLFTKSDIYLLAKILNFSKLSCRNRIPLNENCEFIFFRLDFNNVEVFGFKKPEIIEDKVSKVEDNMLADATSALFKFFENAIYYAEDSALLIQDGDDVEKISIETQDLDEYLKFYKQQTKLHKDYATNAYLTHLLTKLQNIDKSKYTDIFLLLEEMIKDYNEYLDRNNSILTRIAIMIEQLNEESKAYDEKSDLAYPIIYSSLLQAFLEYDKTLVANAYEKKSEMLSKKIVFQEFFNNAALKIKNFVNPIASFAVNGVVSHFHTWLMQMMPLKEFIEFNPSFIEGDKRLSNVPPDVIDKVCIKPAPPKLMSIFENPTLFDFIETELRGAEIVEIPLEAIHYISSAINLIQRMFDLAIGGSPQADEMTPLFNFSLLSSHLNYMFSFEKYLEHFLYELPQNDVKFMNELVLIALTHFINHVSSLDQILSQVLSEM